MKPRVILGASALFLPMAVAGFAQQPAPKNPQDTGAHAESYGKTRDQCFIHDKSDVIGAHVQSPSGEKLGKIEDVVLDNNDGTVAYAVLSYGGILGMGDKLFAVPWDILTPVHEPKEDHPYFVMPVDKEQLKQSPGFPKDNWPDLDSEWAKSIHGFYAKTGVKGDEIAPGKVISDTAKLHLLKLDDLKGCNVKTSDDAKAGEINDVAIDLNRGRVAYVVLASGGVLGFGTDKYAVPFEALTFSVDKDKDLQCQLKVPKAKFEKAPAFESFKTASDQPFVERVYTYYGYPFYWTGATESSMGKEQAKSKEQ